MVHIDPAATNKKQLTTDILDYQPDVVAIEERPVPGKVRWVLYLILLSLVVTVISAILFKIDRIVVAEGELITTEPTIIVQPLTTAIIREIHVELGDRVVKDQILATLDPTFASADLSQLSKQQVSLEVQIRRIQAELSKTSFFAHAKEGEDGLLQEQVFRQRKVIFDRNKQMTDDRLAALDAKLTLNGVQRKGQEQQAKLLRDVEGATARLPQRDEQYQLRLLDAQKARLQVLNSIDNLKAEELVTKNEIKQVRSEWQKFVEERLGELLEQQVRLRSELEGVLEELHKARRIHELVELRAPADGVVLEMAIRSVGSIIQQAEAFVTIVPAGSTIEAEVNVETKDVGRIRAGDQVRIKLDAFPFQKHGTLAGKVRVISEDAYQNSGAVALANTEDEEKSAPGFYRTRINFVSNNLRDVPQGFRIIPGMKVRAEIKIGTRRVITYFLYPIIRALDESLREP